MKNKASLLLMELLVMILVFALAAAVCLQGFAYGAKTSQKISRQEAAVFLAQSAAEELKACRGNTQFPATCFYDGQLQPVQIDEDWDYCLEMEKIPTQIPGLGQAEVRVTDEASGQLVTLTIGWQEA